MLETVNMLVGLAVVMLLLSFAVTLITQFLVGLLNLRGWALRSKVKNLLVLIDNGIHPTDAAHIAGLVLRDAMIGKPGLPWFSQAPMPDSSPPGGGARPPAGSGSPPASRGWKIDWRWPFGFGFRTASVVQREELVRLLLAFGMTPSQYPKRWHWFLHWPLNTADLQAKMRASLAGNGLSQPEDVLDRFRLQALKLEQDKPDLSNSQRQTEALLETAQSAFLGKLNGWFDQTVDRAGDLFTGWTQFAAFLVALVVAGALQVDSIALINRLSTDSEVRGKLVDWAVKNVGTPPPAKQPTDSSAPSNGQPKPPKPAPNRQTADASAPSNGQSEQPRGPPTELQQNLSSAAIAALSSNDLIPLPETDHWLRHWLDRWRKDVPCPTSTDETSKDKKSNDGHDSKQPALCTLPRVSLAGVALSTVLLSLGGPFWYSTLSGLLKLRSTLAGKDDKERKDRQTDTTPNKKPA